MLAHLKRASKTTTTTTVKISHCSWDTNWTRSKISHACRVYEMFPQNHNISWLQVFFSFVFVFFSFCIFVFLSCCLFYFPPKPQCLMITSFVTYHTRATMVKISHCSWDSSPDPQYLTFAEFMRCFTKTTISHGCRFREILHLQHNVCISLLYLSFFFLSFCPFVFLSSRFSWCGCNGPQAQPCRKCSTLW